VCRGQKYFAVTFLGILCALASFDSQEVLRIGFSSAIMIIGGAAQTKVTLTFVSRTTGNKCVSKLIFQFSSFV
jgi:hypothetical protein